MAPMLKLDDDFGESATDGDEQQGIFMNESSDASHDMNEMYESRTVYVNDVHNRNEEQAFMGNRISTSKYNIVTFIPKFLFEQFSRYANLFFLFTAIIQQIPDVSPTGRYTTILPLSAVLAITAAKELAEDRKRHQADGEVNDRTVKVFREGTFVTIKWTEVKVGDIVKVLNHSFFPADMILLSSSEPQGMCYVETANLDGETNLKIRQAHVQTAHMTSVRDVRFLQGSIEAEPPNNRLYKFVGNFNITQQTGSNEPVTLSLSADQLLLRGAQLRNTPWVYGVVVYTGHESKLLRNTTAAPIKRSNVDEVTNRQIIYLFITLMSLAFVSAIANIVWLKNHKTQDWYLEYRLEGPQNFMLTMFTFVILYNNLIPISLVMTLELVKFVQGLTFINNDLDMYCEESNTPARARTSTLNEELGQVEYIFSDKTGTLTRNVMQFLKCTIAGVKYGDTIEMAGDNDGAMPFHDPALLDNLTSGHHTASVIREWLTLLAVCHTVVPERDPSDPDTIVYQAASPDERALVEAVKQLGFSFNVRTPESVVISALGQEETYQILNVLEFNSTRKRMSIIVRDPNGRIKLYCKGADSVIYERLAPNQAYSEITTQHLTEFATDGLRTLCLAVAEISQNDYDAWVRVFNAANTSIVDRSQKLDDAAELIEKNMYLLGATAIEDKLQGGVPETIRALATAGIKIWVLTGDKTETAINIGHSCKLLTRKMEMMVCDFDSEEEVKTFVANKQAACNGRNPDELALVIDGTALRHALSENVAEDWLTLAKMCKAVICCRVSPLQKAQVVGLVKKSVKAITLAIGDGANDVGMIQAAHVGVGISGQEGLQAARASDYSIAQFRFLKKLLLVHGSWSYRRITTLILYTFYKNIALYLIQLWFAFNNGFSGQILFEQWNIASYNVVFTLLPPLALGIFDQHCSKESLLAVPQLYLSNQRGDQFNTRVFWGWTINSIYHSALLFWLPMSAFGVGVVHGNGEVDGQWVLGAIVYTMVVVTVTLKAAMEMKYWTKWSHLALWLSLLIWFIWTFVYFELWKTRLFGIASEVYGVDRQMYASAVYWFTLFLIPIFALSRDFVYLAIQTNFYPRPEDIIREQEIRGAVMPSMPDIEMDIDDRIADGVQADFAYHGYAFSQNESSAHFTQSDLVRKYDTTAEKPQGD